MVLPAYKQISNGQSPLLRTVLEGEESQDSTIDDSELHHLDPALVMPISPPKAPRQPKLRSSCDGCGAVKGKCDRKHPNCGRCITHGITCIYGVSQKIGKPPRDRINSGGGRDPEQFSGVGDLLMSDAWDPVDDDNHNNHTTNHKDNDKSNNTENNKPNENNNKDNNNSSGAVFNLDAFLGDSYGNLPGSSIADFTSLDFGKWADADGLFHCSAPSLEAPGKLGLQGDSTTQRCPPSDRGGSPPPAIKDHDCHREAHEVLGWSLFANAIRNGPNGLAVPPVSPSTIGSGTDGVALDHLLLLNREASERLGSLLACRCAGAPYLMILYASLINAMLTRYQRAAGGTLGASWSPLGASGADRGESSTMLSVQQAVGPAMAPARITIGAFSVVDHRAQSALEIQLLAGEVRKVARLIDQFASYHSDSQYLGEQPGSSSSVDGLHQSLSLWLMGEHSRITNMIRTRLRELL